MYILITSLLLATSFACVTSNEETTVITKSSSSITVSEIELTNELPTFQLYGELAPVNYLNGGEDILTLEYGFIVERVAGCEIYSDLVETVKKNNRQANEKMIASFGKNWKNEFEKETGKKLVFPH